MTSTKSRFEKSQLYQYSLDMFLPESAGADRCVETQMQVGGGSRPARRVAEVQHTADHVRARREAAHRPSTTERELRLSQPPQPVISHYHFSTYDSDPPLGNEQPRSSQLPSAVESVRGDSGRRHHVQLRYK